MRKYKDKRTEKFAQGEHVKEFAAYKLQIEKRLEVLEAATDINDLSRLPSNRFHALSGDRAGQFSIRINDRLRLCFYWSEGLGATMIEIVDYH